MNEKEINLAIYNTLADIAREVFNHLTADRSCPTLPHTLTTTSAS